MITAEDRRKELRLLVTRMRDNPSCNWDEERQRAAVLRKMLSGTATRKH